MQTEFMVRPMLLLKNNKTVAIKSKVKCACKIIYRKIVMKDNDDHHQSFMHVVLYDYILIDWFFHIDENWIMHLMFNNKNDNNNISMKNIFSSFLYYTFFFAIFFVCDFKDAINEWIKTAMQKWLIYKNGFFHFVFFLHNLCCDK
jgi:hypothetical protein